MPKHKADIYHTDITYYIAQRVGLTPQEATRVVYALSEFIVICLIQRFKIVLPRIGTLEVRGNRARTTTKFVATDQLYSWLRKSEVGYKPESIDLVPPLTAAAQEAYNQRKKEQGKAEEEHKLDGLASSYTSEAGALRLHFLQYLQQQFPYNQPWVNPASKKEYSAGRVRDILAKVQAKICPEDFNCLYLLWVGCSKRRQLAVFESYTPDTLKRSWGRAVDAVLVMLEFEDIAPNLVKELIKPIRD